jgi:GNAT superfamily N-acetyltransferase
VSVGNGVYPADLERDVPLRDGGTIHLRPIKADDVKRLQAFHGRLSRDSIFFRFFSPLPILTDERAAYFTTVDYDHRLAIVAVERRSQGEQDGEGEQHGEDEQDREDEQIVGVVRYDRSDEDTAEFALIVEDRVQHHGIGSTLFTALVEAARARGLRTLAGDVLAENRRMINLLRESGFPMKTRRSGNAIRVELDLTAAPS